MHSIIYLIWIKIEHKNIFDLKKQKKIIIKQFNCNIVLINNWK